MAETTTAATNKLVAFKGRAQKERTMPLEPGRSSDVISRNISELHGGKTFRKTKKKFGKRKAAKQAVAIAMSKAREIPGAGHNPPKPHHADESLGVVKQPHSAKHDAPLHKKAHHAKTAVKHVPRHMRGRGMISEKAMAIMGKQLSETAKPAVGKHVAAAGKSRSAKPDAVAAKPWKGQKLPGWASDEQGKQDAEQARYDS